MPSCLRTLKHPRHAQLVEVGQIGDDAGVGPRVAGGLCGATRGHALLGLGSEVADAGQRLSFAG